MKEPPVKNLRRILGLVIIVAGMAGVANADASAPEIDPGTAGSAMTMIIGGLLLIKDRFRGK
jgi:hypothetical protein